jgi:hypothetical protein
MGVVVFGKQSKGSMMSRTHVHHHATGPAFVPGGPRTRYLVVRQNDQWHIKFDGEQYGPYATEREAMLFAVDAAHTLGAQGEPTQVLRVDENGDTHPEWTFGQDPYPPRH